MVKFLGTIVAVAVLATVAHAEPCKTSSYGSSDSDNISSVARLGGFRTLCTSSRAAIALPESKQDSQAAQNLADRLCRENSQGAFLVRSFLTTKRAASLATVDLYPVNDIAELDEAGQLKNVKSALMNPASKVVDVVTCVFLSNGVKLP